MTVFLLLCAAGLLPLLLILTMPVVYRVSAVKQETLSGEAKINWLGNGLVIACRYDSQNGLHKDIKLFGIKLGFTGKPDKKPEIAPKKRRLPLRRLWGKTLLQSTIRFLAAIFKHLRPQTFRVAGRIGLDDPYQTAMMISLVSLLRLSDVSIEPVFDEEVFTGSLLIQGRLIIGVAVILFIKFLITRPVRKALIKWVKNKEEKSYVY